MKKDFRHIKFNLTPDMSLQLIKFNKLKKELLNLQELYNLDIDEKLLLRIKQKEKELLDTKNKFIYEFRLNNQEEIQEYLRIKNQF